MAELVECGVARRADLPPEAFDLCYEIAPSVRREELFHLAARPLITRISRLKVMRRRLAVLEFVPF
jgi:hypothetical protein